MAAPLSKGVTELLVDCTNGDHEALDKLIPVVYEELHRLASHYLRRERANHTLQTTALVHEAYLRLVDQKNSNWQNRAQFFGVAAQMMRRILVDYARSHRASKRGGSYHRISLSEGAILSEDRDTDLTELDEVLERLATIDPQQSRVVELRIFGGLTVEETAEVMGISSRTVKREWSMARAWLHQQIKKTAKKDE
ncbi:MAG TPA: sigma-70 family RNA polymerase sigma factor [Blastocatellia bacterium]|nr:sigma-70 family RNA polymerase sigma factor [Blastocatellia bacterium]